MEIIEKKGEDDFVKYVVKQIEQKFGSGAATTLSSDTIISHVPGYVRTGCTGLDYAISRPGIPLGRLTEVCGFESVGKTLLGIHILTECQKMGGVAVLIDSEQAFEPAWAKQIGLDADRLVCLQPDSQEEVFAQMEYVIKTVKEKKSKVPMVILLDSLAGAPTKAEVEGNFGDIFPAVHARLIASSIRKILPLITKEKIGLVIINQLKERVGIMFGEKSVSFGGRALKFHATVRIKLTRTGYIKNKNEIVGIAVKAKVIKNKIAPPFKECRFDIYFERGIDNASSLLPLAEEQGVIKRSGGFYVAKNEKFRAKDFGSSKIFKSFENQLRQSLRSRVF